MKIKGDHTKNEIEITKQNLIFSNQYVNVYNDNVVFPDENHGTYLRITTPTNRSVAILPITKRGNIVLIKNYRHGVRGWGIEVPKGAVDFDESAEEAALRELEEETGYVCKKLIHICRYSESPSIFSSEMDCFLALDCEPKGSLKRENTEAISAVLEMAPESFLERTYPADFIDSISELLVCQYQLKRKEHIK